MLTYHDLPIILVIFHSFLYVYQRPFASTAFLIFLRPTISHWRLQADAKAETGGKNTMFSGMNIHLFTSYFDVNRRGTRFWHTAIWGFRGFSESFVQVGLKKGASADFFLAQWGVNDS